MSWAVLLSTANGGQFEFIMPLMGTLGTIACGIIGFFLRSILSEFKTSRVELTAEIHEIKSQVSSLVTSLATTKAYNKGDKRMIEDHDEKLSEHDARIRELEITAAKHLSNP